MQVWPVVLKHHGRKLWNIGYIFCKIESIDILFYPKLNCKSKAARCRSINWKSILNHRYARKILRMREFCCRHYDYHYYTVSSSLLLLLCQLLKHLRGGGQARTLQRWYGTLLASCWVYFTLNPVSPKIHKQILQTDLYTFPYRISWEKLIKDQRFFSLWSFD